MGLGTGLGEDGQLGSAVCYQLLEGIEKKGHILVCDNFFSSVKLFHNLLCKGIFATGTIIRNRKVLPKALTRQGDMTNPGVPGNEDTRWKTYGRDKLAGQRVSYLALNSCEFLGSERHCLATEERSGW
jgi:hypothetical protein